MARRWMLALALAAATGARAHAQAPDAPPIDPAQSTLQSLTEVRALVAQARREIVYLTEGVPPELADTLAALRIPVYVLLPDRALTSAEQRLARGAFVRMRLSGQLSGAGALMLLDRQRIVVGPLLAPAQQGAPAPTMVVWMPDPEPLLRMFRYLWDQGRAP